MKKNTPKISIVIPSYNKGAFIKKTLESIVSQNYQNLEVIVQDGGSTDSTLKILNEFSRNYPFISFQSKKDKGQTDAINIGLEKISGDICTFINADDYYKPGALSAVAGAYVNNPDAEWFAGRGNVVDENNREIAKAVTAYKSFLLKLNMYQLLLVVNYFYQPSVFVTRKAMTKLGGFTGHQRFVLEYDLWLRLGKKKMPIVINKLLSSFRMSRSNFSSTSFDTILQKDFEIARANTRNSLLLLLHKLHNYARRYLLKSLVA